MREIAAGTKIRTSSAKIGFGGWQGVVAPLGTPANADQRVQRIPNKVLSEPDLAKQLALHAAYVDPMSPPEAAIVPAGTAVSNLASWAELFHLYDLVPYLTKPLDVYSRWVGWAATFMALIYYAARAYENRDWFKRHNDNMRKRLF